MNIKKIELKQISMNRSERKLAQVIAYPIALLLMIIFYLLKLITKLLYKAKRWLWRISIFSLMFFIACSNLTFQVKAPYADASKQYAVPTLAPHTVQENLILSKTHGDILFRIWTLESTRGKNGRIECEAKGKVNDFGFDVSDHVCFKDFNTELNAVNAWFDNELRDHSLSNALCVYNQGIDESNCTYAKNFMGI